MPLFIDTETYSERPIRDGTYAYAEHAEVMIVSYAVDDGPIGVWETDIAPMPAELENAFRSECELVAHNVMFDRTVLRLGNLKIDLPVKRWHCTMARAMAHSLPGKLATLSAIFNLGDEGKHDGRLLINLFCKPRPKNSKLRRATRDSHPAEWERFVAYAGGDISAMRALYRKLPRWNYAGRELELWHLDQQINDRGVAVDVAFSEAALASLDRVQAKLASETHDATNGDVAATTQRDKLLAHILREHGVALPDLKASTLETRLNDENLPAVVRELILTRLEASQTSGKKHKALLRGASSDGRLRGLLRYCGASRTGRWAGQMFQPQNLTRPPKYLEGGAYDEAVEVIKGGAVDLIYDKPLEVVSGTVRGALVAAPGRKLVISDLANIEGRYAAWTAGEEWKLEKFRQFDAGIGEDLYKVAYGAAFQVDPAKVGEGLERQIGKVMELMLQYEGGVGSFLTGAATYGIDLSNLADRALPTIPEDVVRESRSFLAWMRKNDYNTYGLDDDVYVACESLKRLWRAAHPAISSLWNDLDTAARDAIRNPGETFTCRKVSMRHNGAWLGVRLPSGRTMCYPRARINTKGKVAYDGVNQYTRKWGEITSYGGKWLENITQAGSRDVMAAAMPAVEQAKFEIVLSVHDELVTEAPDSDEFSAKGLSSILAAGAPWTEGLPLAAKGTETYRYRKE